MSDIVYLILGIPIAILIYKLYYKPVFKVYKSFPNMKIFKSLNDEELSYDFKIRHGILYTLMDIWIITMVYIVDSIIKHQDELSQLSQMNFEFNINEVKMTGIIILALFILLVLLIPILLIIYLIKHHFELKKYEFKRHSRIGVEITQFIVGITSLASFPLGVGVKLVFFIIDLMFSSSGSKGTTKTTTWYKDSKGEYQIATTFTNNDNGSSETYWRDDSGELHKSYIDKM